MKKKHPESLHNCLTKFKKSLPDVENLINISRNWENIIGKELSKECKPLKIEKNLLIISVNHPQWRQALIYNKHKLIESIRKFGINLSNIRIIQYYGENIFNENKYNSKFVWENHPSRVKNKRVILCKSCARPTPEGEIERWGKCTFCWRKDN